MSVECESRCRWCAWRDRHGFTGPGTNAVCIVSRRSSRIANLTTGDRLALPASREVERKPGGAIGSPMTCMLNGCHYIALAVGGDAPSLVAYVLPQ